MWTDGLSEEEIKESVYPKVDSELPACMGRHGAKFKGKRLCNSCSRSVRSCAVQSLDPWLRMSLKWMHVGGVLRTHGRETSPRRTYPN